MLQSLNDWNSVYVDYHKPFVKRMWKKHEDFRIYLHQISPCQASESLLHPHPWPSSMKVISGTYEMGVGYSKENTAPPIASRLLLPVNSYYEMLDVNSWHYVRPLGRDSFSLMVTGKPWAKTSAESKYTFRELTESEKTIIINEFKKHYAP